MEQLADNGDGNFAYNDTLEEARKLCVEDLTSTLQVIARDHQGFHGVLEYGLIGDGEHRLGTGHRERPQPLAFPGRQ